ncbi:unnamed protein product, partial [Mesorhabditis spiculigera]
MERIEAAIANAIKYRALNALITETFDLARKQAQNAISRGIKPFPVVIKDCFTVQGVPTTCASKMLEGFVPQYSATAAQRLIDSGGCLIGKGNMDEFSMGTSSSLGYFGPVKNGLSKVESIDEDWIVPGGSSGGPGVAVQMGMADCALGSDTGGSVRNPAAFTGTFGFKPTYGRISRSGLIPLVNSLEAPAIFAQSASDCGKYFDVINRREYFERALKVRRLIANEIYKVFDEVDLLLTPVAQGAPPLFSHLHAGNFSRESTDDFYTQSVNMAGVPAISIPLGESEGLPLAIQLVANRKEDEMLLQAAQVLYQAR